MNSAEREHYDALLDGGFAPFSCPVCTGDETAEPCSEECAELVARVRVARAIRGHEADNARILSLVAQYEREGGPTDNRIGPCLARVERNEMVIAQLRRVA